MRFLLDENIHPKVAEAAWEFDLDVASVHDLRRRGLSDREHLTYAAAQERVMVTRNRADYVYLTREFYHAGQAHSGVLLVEPNIPPDQPEMLARSLRRWAQAHAYQDEEDVGFGAYHVDYLPR